MPGTTQLTTTDGSTDGSKLRYCWLKTAPGADGRGDGGGSEGGSGGEGHGRGGLTAALATVTAAGRSAAAGCSSDSGCSLNGACRAGVCQCDPPWSGESCGVLGMEPAPPGGAYGYGEEFATTSWGGNVLTHGGKFHLYVTEIAGKRCGLGRWKNQSTVVHAVSDRVEGPW